MKRTDFQYQVIL